MRRLTLLVILMTLTLLVLLINGTTSWGDTGKVEVSRDKKNEATYTVSEHDARDTVEMIESYYRTMHIQDAYIASMDASIRALSADIAEVERAHKAERTAWQKKVSGLMKQVKKYKNPWALGLFGGYDPIRSEATVGVGIVLSIVRF